MMTISSRPNIVWICADDYTPSVCSVYGNQQVRTPYLSRMASEGLCFDRAYCSCPLSTPSRQAFWTGRYPRSIGVTLSPSPLPDDEVTLPEFLSDAGYATAAFGKTHFYQPRRAGLDLHVDIGDYNRKQHKHHPRTVPIDIPTLGPWLPFYESASSWLNSGCLPYQAYDEDMFGTFLATSAAQWLERIPSTPFFLYVSFHETHSPFRFPVEYQGRYDPTVFDIPAVTGDDRARIPWVFQSLTDPEKQGIIASYHTCAEFMDKNVGLVLDALERTGQAAETLVIFTSDHGYFLGEHGRFEKHCCYEEGIRAPFILRWPGIVEQGRVEALVELIDIMPTLLDACAIPQPDTLHGRSLMPLIVGSTDHHREQIITEYADNEECAIRTERWKLIYSTGKRRRLDGYVIGPELPGRSMQLFDLGSDPGERINVAEEHPTVVDDLLARLMDHLAQTERISSSLPRGMGAHEKLEHYLRPVELSMKG